MPPGQWVVAAFGISVRLVAHVTLAHVGTQHWAANKGITTDPSAYTDVLNILSTGAILRKARVTLWLLHTCCAGIRRAPHRRWVFNKCGVGRACSNGSAVGLATRRRVAPWGPARHIARHVVQLGGA